MYCPQCGTQTEQRTKFCKTCGLKLAEHARLLEEPGEVERMTEEQWRREKRLMTGVVLSLVTAFNLLIFLIVFGSTTLPQLSKAPLIGSLITLITFVAVSLIIGGFALRNLIASGFFRNMRERQLRIELALIEQKRKALEAEENIVSSEIPSSPQKKAEAEAGSVSEHTTRELRS